jgi:DNA ligase-1
MAQYPAHVRFYDVLEIAGEDVRTLPWSVRRQRLVDWHAQVRPPRTDLSTVLDVADKSALKAIWDSTRGSGIEGMMLKRRESAYLAGRPKGHWWKWKRSALVADCVLMYAQRGSGKRSSYYSDFTFGCWAVGDDGTARLVPVGKAYSGYTDEELKRLDKWIRDHTTERFGPVRGVEPGLVFEVAFDAVQVSARHKSGIAMRFPRISRIRWDKPHGEADTVDALRKLLA